MTDLCSTRHPNSPLRAGWIALVLMAGLLGAGSIGSCADEAAPSAGFAVVDGVLEVSLRLDAPNRPAFALGVSSGVPLPIAAAEDTTQLALLTAAGKRVPAQFKALSWWPDGSLKWVLVSFVAAAPAGPYRLRCASDAPEPHKGIETQVTSERISIDTGAMRATVARDAQGFLESLAVDLNGNGRYEPDESLGAPAARSFVHLTDAEPNGRPRSGSYFDVAQLRREIELVEPGPVRAVVKITGEHANAAGRATAPYAIWLTFYAGQTYFKVWHTFVTAEPASEVFVRSVGIDLGLRRAADGLASGHDGTPVSAALAADQAAYVLQDDAAMPRWPKLNDAMPLCLLVTAGAAGERILAEGKRCDGYLDVTCAGMGVALCMPRVCREWPKEFSVDNPSQTASAHFWPMHKPEPLDMRPLVERAPPAFARFLSTPEGARWQHRPPPPASPRGMGLAKSHELLCWVHKPRLDPRELAAAVAALESPPLLVATPRYYAHCAGWSAAEPTARPDLSAYDAALTQWCDRLIDAQGHGGHWFGFLDYGDLRRCYFQDAKAWDAFSAGWANGTSEIGRSFFLQFLRTSQRRYFDAAAAWARHCMDVDTLHALDPSCPGALPCRPGPDHSVPGTLEHASPRSLAMYYCLTGNPRAKDVLEELLTLAPQAGVPSWSDRDLSKAVALAAAAVEIDPSPSASARLASCMGQLQQRIGRIGLDPCSHRVINLDTGERYDADLDAFILPALAYAYEASGNADALELMKHCVDAAWPQFECLPALTTLSRQSHDRAYASAAAFSLARVRQRAEPQRDEPLWTEDQLGQASWPQLFAGLAALHAAGVPALPKDVHDAPRDRRAQNELPAEGGWAPGPTDAAFLPIAIDEHCNWAPLAPPACTDRPELIPTNAEIESLGAHEIGFDFGLGHWVEPGFQAVTPEHVYPSRPGDPSPVSGLASLPFGGTTRYQGIPFRLPEVEPEHGYAALLLAGDASAEIAVNTQVQALHLLGGVCLRPKVDSAVGARVTLKYADGEEHTVELRNFEHYQPCGWPPLFVKPSVKLAAELGRWHVNVLSIPAKPKVLKHVRLAAGQADHRVVVLALTAQTDGPATAAPGEPVAVDWELVAADQSHMAISGSVPKGVYQLDVLLSARDRVALDVVVCGRRLLRHVVPQGSMLVTLPPVRCKGRLDVQCTARPFCRAAAGLWGMSVPAVRGAQPPSAVTGPGAQRPPAVAGARLRYGWGIELVDLSMVRAVSLPLRPGSKYQPARLFGDGCIPGDDAAGRTAFWADLANGRYEVRLYMRSGSADECTIGVRAEGAEKLKEVKLLPALDGSQYRRPEPVRFSVDVRDRRLDVEFLGAPGQRGRWVLCAAVVKALGRGK